MQTGIQQFAVCVLNFCNFNIIVPLFVIEAVLYKKSKAGYRMLCNVTVVFLYPKLRIKNSYITLLYTELDIIRRENMCKGEANNEYECSE